MDGRATRLQLLNFSTIPMRTFHLAWMAFFICFFAWFAVAPLMPVIRDDLGLTRDQIANINIAAVCVTIFVRLLIGPLCDRFGARLTYTWLLAVGSIPVMGIAFAQSYEAFLFGRLCIGAIGASFVITQVHTSSMFAPNVVGTANATSAGWGNAGGGATQALMPLILAAIVSVGVEQAMGWRIAMFVPGILMLVMSVVYYRFAKDTPFGNLDEPGVRLASGQAQRVKGMTTFLAAARDYRVWLLFITYGACFGVELTIHNLAAVYYVDRFGLSVATAGFYVGCFGLLALFARALGGIVSDRLARHRGLDSRVDLLFLLILAEGIGLLIFSQMGSAQAAVLAMLAFGVFTHMACGATYALVPFVNRKALGGVAGIVGAGGNVGAVAAGFLVKGTSSTQQALLILGGIVVASAICAVAVRFTAEQKAEERRLFDEAMASRAATAQGDALPEGAT
ncbi:MAG TPA: MFS transporter [Povalibacter sp.]|uniref:MFS transporter n=1 Tax=Povalibacter sp. TaxID=1962978 RepID=UPI002D1D63F1|nr:MFS transporter [Povalibacter sp.]HMN43532.1 MFS transporter [Povalibacter sp.]